jgi:small neutral amino acid transporter SnatA (MarC family)
MAVLYGSDRITKYLSHATVERKEGVLGILLGALAVELIVTGLTELGIISMIAH